MQVVVGSLAIKEILYSSKVRNALVVLADGTTRQQLESLQPDMGRMVSELDTEQLNGVMVTCQGDATDVVPYCRLVVVMHMGQLKAAVSNLPAHPISTCVSRSEFVKPVGVDSLVWDKTPNANIGYSVSALDTSGRKPYCGVSTPSPFRA